MADIVGVDFQNPKVSAVSIDPKKSTIIIKKCFVTKSYCRESFLWSSIWETYLKVVELIFSCRAMPASYLAISCKVIAVLSPSMGRWDYCEMISPSLESNSFLMSWRFQSRPEYLYNLHYQGVTATFRRHQVGRRSSKHVVFVQVEGIFPKIQKQLMHQFLCTKSDPISVISTILDASMH